MRPESLSLGTEGIPASAEFIEVLGADALVICRLSTGERFVVRQPFDAPRPQPDEPVRLTLSSDPRALHAFSAETGERIGTGA